MRTLISPLQMRDMEKRCFAEAGVKSIDLMETAARAVADAALRRWGGGARVFVACGPGGNGGDGYACARLLKEAGCDCALFPSEPPQHPDAAQNRVRALSAGIPELRVDDTAEAPDVWIDALYGTGLSRAPEGAAEALIGRVNADAARGSRVLAVDIPSGLNGQTGAAYTPCVRADVTVAFQFAKVGCYLSDGLDVCGNIEVADIGIPAGFFPADLPRLMEPADALSWLPPKPRNAHKGNNGHLLIVAGSFGMAGAAAICAQSALRSGVGLVTVACPASVVPILQTLAPCAIAVPLAEAGGTISGKAAETIASILPGKSAVVCGCGLSRQASTAVIGRLLASGIPTLFDADGLNLIAVYPGLRDLLKPHHLLTPHPAEAARLLDRKLDDPIADAFALKELGCQALLKGTTTVIPVGDTAWLSASGGSGMAKGGSGDCLSGLAGGLMAQCAASGISMTGEELACCAAVASELHGRAGEIAQAKRGIRGMTALDIVEALPEALMGLG